MPQSTSTGHAHPHGPHTEEHFTGNAAVRDIVIGMADGLTVPFALAAGLSGAVDTTTLIVTAGVAEIAAGSIAMGLGGYLAGRGEAEHYRHELARERREVQVVPQREEEEILEILMPYGVREETARAVVADLKQDPERWVQFMMRYELNLDEPHPTAARWSALRIGLAYIAGGLVPLMPYILVEDPYQALLYSSGFTLFILFVFGYLKARLTGRKDTAWRSAVETTLIGGVAAATAYAIANWLG